MRTEICCLLCRRTFWTHVPWGCEVVAFLCGTRNGKQAHIIKYQSVGYINMEEVRPQQYAMVT